MCRRCGERDRRGAARDRRARKRWLLKEFGDGTTVECFWGCGTKLTFATLEQDRIVPGGPYRRDNLVPSCGPCNIKRAAETIPDGCYYGPVGDLVTDRHGRYLDEPELAAPDRAPAKRAQSTAGRAATTIPQPRNGSAALTRAGSPAETTASDKGLTAMHFPRPHRSAHRATPPPDHQRQPAAVSAVALAEHTHDDRPAATEPDLVVIDTTDLDELQARHPWLFTERPDGDVKDTRNSVTKAPRLDRIDADLAAAEDALAGSEEDERTAVHVQQVVDDADGYDAGWGR